MRLELTQDNSHYPLKVARLPFRHLSMKDLFDENIGSSDCRAEDGAQTRDPQLGRLVLYQLSYFRSLLEAFAAVATAKRLENGCKGKV